MKVSKEEIKSRIERILSDILSDKHEAKITIKFSKSEDVNNGNNDQTRSIKKKRVLDK